MTTSTASTSRVRHKRWVIAPLAPIDHLKRFPDIAPLVVQILYNRGMTDPDEMAAFLQADRPTSTADLFRMAGMNRTVDRIRRAIKAREPIAIYGDYDVDGVTATALLVQTLAAFGANVRPYIPRRADEGYGLNLEALQHLKERRRAAGHHRRLRRALVVRSRLRQSDRAGSDRQRSSHAARRSAGCLRADQSQTTRLSLSLQRTRRSRTGLQNRAGPADRQRQDRRIPSRRCTEDDLLDLVALGTVADLAPLLGENRLLVARGLQQLRRTQRPGLRALMQISGVKTIDTSTIGFALGPRLNAAGRLDHALNAYDLLMTTDPAKADRIALDLDLRNRERQTLTRELSDKAREIVMAHSDGSAALLFAADPSFNSGVVGLVASRLTEEFYRPSVVIEQGPHESRGSCRSIPEFHITQALDECRELFVRHGGHAAAAGFTIETAKLDTLSQRLSAIAERELGGQELLPTLADRCGAASAQTQAGTLPRAATTGTARLRQPAADLCLARREHRRDCAPSAWMAPTSR